MSMHMELEKIEEAFVSLAESAGYSDISRSGFMVEPDLRVVFDARLALRDAAEIAEALEALWPDVGPEKAFRSLIQVHLSECLPRAIRSGENLEYVGAPGFVLTPR